MSTALLTKSNGSTDKLRDASLLQREVWNLIYEIYDCPAEDRKEIDTWFKRRYPNFGRDLVENEPGKRAGSTKKASRLKRPKD